MIVDRLSLGSGVYLTRLGEIETGGQPGPLDSTIDGLVAVGDVPAAAHWLVLARRVGVDGFLSVPERVAAMADSFITTR